MVLRPIRPAGLPRAEAPWATVDHLPAGSPGGPGRRTPGAGDGTEEGDRRRRRAGGGAPPPPNRLCLTSRRHAG